MATVTVSAIRNYSRVNFKSVITLYLKREYIFSFPDFLSNASNSTGSIALAVVLPRSAPFPFWRSPLASEMRFFPLSGAATCRLVVAWSLDLRWLSSHANPQQRDTHTHMQSMCGVSKHAMPFSCAKSARKGIQYNRRFFSAAARGQILIMCSSWCMSQSILY